MRTVFEKEDFLVRIYLHSFTLHMFLIYCDWTTKHHETTRNKDGWNIRIYPQAIDG
jgi:hypothetical protein